jgi:glyoxylase-like metal-dependent hydrolase (beta-lactamase superfamily II)
MPEQRPYFLRIEEGLSLIPLDLKHRGFRNFISSWVFRSNSLTILVDPGPKATISKVVASLPEIGVTHLDYILLTHIHIDHAGGAGLLSDAYPEAKVVCHPKAAGHLVDPSRLWEASRKVLGPLAEAYGEIVPVKEDRIISNSIIEKGGQTITCIETPGHAVHHVSFIFNRILFAGEVAGVFYDLGDGRWYLRPATPPVFRLDIWINSLDRLSMYNPEWICVGHFGMNRSPGKILNLARDQLHGWTQIIQDLLNESEVEIVERAFTILMDKDPHFCYFRLLDEDIQERERYFFGNTIQGILGYLKEGTIN